MQKQRDEKLMRAETVSVLVALSRAFTQTSGHRVLKHWSQLQSGLQNSLRGVGTIGQWQEKIRLRLRITTVSSLLSAAFDAHETGLEEAGYDFHSWLWLVQSELAWFMKQLRLESEHRNEAHEQSLLAAELEAHREDH